MFIIIDYWLFASLIPRAHMAVSKWTCIGSWLVGLAYPLAPCHHDRPFYFGITINKPVYRSATGIKFTDFVAMFFVKIAEKEN